MVSEFYRVSRIIWKECLRLKPSDHALIVTDENKLKIGESLYETGRKISKNCTLLNMKIGKMHGEEPPQNIAKIMLKSDIIICPTTYSMTHTKAAQKAAKRGAKIVTMPGITEEGFLKVIPINYKKLNRSNERLISKIEGSEWVHVSTEAGTSIQLNLKGRKFINGNGIIRKGKVSNLPAGEIFTAPNENKSEGVIVVDVTSAPFGRVDKPFRITVEKGHAVSCTNKKLWNILKKAKNGTNLAEIGIGTNPKAVHMGNTLVDEKLPGTAHIAFGTNKSMGGKIQSTIHLDQVFNKPTIEVDGKVIIKDGKII